MVTGASERAFRLIRLGRQVTSIVPVGMGVGVLIGWWLGVEWLKSFLHPNRIAMNPASAVSFIFAGTALWLLGGPRGREARAGGIGCTLVVLVIACLRLVGYYGGWDGVDRSLFASVLGDNRMAPNTALALGLSAWSLLFLDVRIGRIWPAQLGALGAGGIALLSLTGYLYGASEFYRVSGFIPMALNSAVTFAVLSAGILLARPERQPVAALTSPTAGGVLACRLLPMAFVVPLGLGWLVVLGVRSGRFGAELGIALFVLGVVVVFNVLLWWTSRSLAISDERRTRAERRMGAEHAVSRVLAEVRTLEEGAPGIIGAVCRSVEWDAGAVWMVDREGDVLRCIEFGGEPGARPTVPEFERATRERTFERGVGLPGRAWGTAKPAWIVDVVLDANFPRAPIAQREGLHGAIAFPIALGGEVAGVVEFFSREVRVPDAEMLAMLGAIGSQIGQFVERTRAEAEVRRGSERLAARVDELQRALAEVRQLRGLLPICAYCKRIREGTDYTRSVEQYLAEHTDAKFSHGVCPACYEKHVRPRMEKL